MNLILLAERFVGLTMLIFGLSHILAARQWVGCINELFVRPWAGLLLGAVALPMGLAVVLTHNVWGLHLGVITTIIGWVWSIKGGLYLVAPGSPRRLAAGFVSELKFRVAGVACLLIGAVVSVNAYWIP